MSRQPPSKDNNSSTNSSNSRNEYIPQYISAKPFYAEDLLKDTEYLSHQRAKAEQKDTLDKAKWYERGRKSGPAATKYRKGACENCGAMTHKTRDCLSRPRKTGAKWSGRDIQADELVEDVKLGWDAKRDRWNGYDVREYDSVVKDYEDMEGLRKITGSAKNEGEGGDAEESADGNGVPKDANGVEDDDTRYAEETDMGRTQPTSTRQLRLREDTAKYLLDLNLDSAKYDPKTRSMDTTTQNINAAQSSSGTINPDLASEGFVRPSHDPKSDAAAFERAQRYAWEAQEGTSSTTPNPSLNQIEAPPPASAKMHLEANPTASALLHKRHLEEQAAKKAQQKSYLSERYGIAPSTGSSTTPKPSIPVSVSTYVTYDPATGLPLDATTGKPQIKPVAKSKYPEDIYPGNHNSVFGSFWKDGRWGYQCCHSFVKNSYCTGDEGRRAFEEEEAQRLGRSLLKDGVGGSEDGEQQVESLVSKKRKADADAQEGDRDKRSKTEDP